MKKHCNEQMSFFDQLQDDELIIVSCLPISCVRGPRDIIVLVITKEKSNYYVSVIEGNSSSQDLTEEQIYSLKTQHSEKKRILNIPTMSYLKSIELNQVEKHNHEVGTIVYSSTYTDFTFKYNHQIKKVRINKLIDSSILLNH